MATVASRPRAAGRRPAQHWSVPACLVLPALALAAGGWQRRWVSEDGFISLRVVRQLLAGHGPVFNVGERVEAATSPLWTFLLAGLRAAVPLPLEYLAVAAGLAGAAGGLLLGSWAAVRLWGGAAWPRRAHAFVPMGALVVAALAPFWDFATSGLETGLVFAWLGASAAVLAREAAAAGAAHRAAHPPWPAAVMIGLGPLVRPDLAVFSAAFLVALVAGHPGPRREKAALAAVALAVPVAYQLFRMGFYAAIVPNPGLAKEASAARWDQGWRYLVDFFGPYRLAVPLAAGAVALAALLRAGGRHRRLSPVLLAAVAPVAGAVLHAGYIVRVGGDFMHARLLLPAVFGALLPVMAVPARGRVVRAAAAVTAAWAVVCAATLEPVYVHEPPYVGADGIVNERAFWVKGSGGRRLVRVEDYEPFGHYQQGRTLRDWAEERRTGLAVRPDPLVGEYALLPFRRPAPARIGIAETHVGIIGMVAGPEVHVVDHLGLADAMAARLRLTTRGRPGHEKDMDRAWVWGRLVADDAPALPSSPPPEAVAAAREALGCGPLRSLVEAVSEPLTPWRFLRNLAAAPALHGLRFDNDPLKARAELCR